MVFLKYIFDRVPKAALSLSGIFGGPTLGIYSLGMFVPIMNALSAVIGYFFGFGTALWIYFGSTSYPSLKRILNFKDIIGKFYKYFEGKS